MYASIDNEKSWCSTGRIFSLKLFSIFLTNFNESTHTCQTNSTKIDTKSGGGGLNFYTYISSIYIQRRFLMEYCEMFTSFTPHTAFQRYHPNTFMSLAKRNPPKLSMFWLCTRLLALKPEEAESVFPNRKYGLFYSIE